jgi:3-phosphoshikimate 1-carboxyvinyltransferase
MKSFTVSKISASSFNFEISNIATDKSISHRCAIFSMLSNKTSYIKNYLLAEDTLNTLSIVEQLGAIIQKDSANIKITPPENFIEPSDVLDCGNSGTAIRLLSGFLACVDGYFILSGDKYLRKRPMGRVVNPLKNIGATILGRENNKLAPLTIIGSKLKSFDYESSIASAQVKSAMILAGLNSDGTCTYKEPELSRDHTEKMLSGMGLNISTNNSGQIVFSPLTKPLEPLDIEVPCDPSSAFFFAVAATILPNCKIILKNVLLNKTRIEAFEVLKKMGADIEYINIDTKYDKVGDITVKSSSLEAVVVEDNISWLIDEIPALSIAFIFANGISIIKNAEELRVKESDRIKSTVSNLNKCGVETEEFEDGFSVKGGCTLNSSTIDSFGDHRIAMSFSILGLVTNMTINDTQCIETSFPNFIDILEKFTKVNICK